jgi:Fe-S oxidoreductase
MLNAALFTLCLFAGLGYFLYQLQGRFNLLRAAKGKFTLDHVGERIWSVVLIALGQYKFIRPEAGIVNERFAGWVHTLVFWGFSVLGVQVVTMFGRAYSPDFPWLPAFIWNPYQLLRDFFEVTVFVCVVILIARWLITQPKRLIGYAPAEDKQRSHAHWEAYFILACIGVIVSSGLVYDGGRLVQHWQASGSWEGGMWEPFSFVTGRTLMAIGGPQLPIELVDVAWWMHNIAILTMLNFLPLAKHFHIITSLPNVFFRKLEPLGAMSKMDLENAETFGTSHIDQFTWKQVLDMFSCTECGRCSSQCPATATGKPLAPRQLLLNLRDYLYEHQDEVIEKRIKHASGNGAEAMPVGENIVGPVIEDEVLWSCNMCRACEEACPVVIEYVDKIVDMRRHLVQEEARFPSELTRVFKGMETQSNPWGIGAEKRFDWADGLDIPTLADKPDAEYLYYVGCAGAFDDRNKKTTQAFARILQKGGIDFACLAGEEPCNGDSARRLGNEYLYQAMAQMCVETFNGYGVKKVIVNCPHCFNTIKNELPQFDGTYEVIHAAELVRDLIAKGRLQVPAEFDKRVAYHDSCYYGRFNDVYDEPREVLTKSGATLEEMKRHKHFGMCCGAGGGRMWIEEDADRRVNLLRTDQALETNPEVIAVSCPFCMTMLSDGIKAKDLEDRVETLDVMEIVDRVSR